MNLENLLLCLSSEINAELEDFIVSHDKKLDIDHFQHSINALSEIVNRSNDEILIKSHIESLQDQISKSSNLSDIFRASVNLYLNKFKNEALRTQ